jgi:organic radical activating enzyme|tara:strand:+ start:1858 stop:2925 length:1068 start_codon:yes stop_codon:yes gene_type:complete
MNIEFDVTLQCNFSCVNCNRHSNFNDLSSPLTGGKSNKVGLDYYENTNITIEKTKKFIEEVKENGTVERIHLIGGEPLVHPHMDKICDLMREELWGKYVREILIISNLHPKMLKKGTLDTPEQIVKYAPDRELDVAYEHSSRACHMVLTIIRDILAQDSNGLTKENIMDYAEEITATHPELEEMNLRQILEYPSVYLFHGIPVINYKPLSAKHEEHRCSLVAPVDTEQEMIDKCNHPKHCGQNYAWDGYYPCANGAAIARLFKLDKYRRDTLPKNESDWDGIDENGIAHTKSEGMYDLCKLCQVAAKNQLWERDHGRPISVSYRKALGLEGNERTSEYVIEGHKKKLAPNPGFIE